MHDQFKKELTDLINMHGLDRHCKAPDHVLADYMIRCVDALTDALSKAIELEVCCNNCKHNGNQSIYRSGCTGCAVEIEYGNFEPLTPNPEPTVSGDE